MKFDDPSADVWLNTTENILNETFSATQAFGMPDGEPHKNTRNCSAGSWIETTIASPITQTARKFTNQMDIDNDLPSM